MTRFEAKWDQSLNQSYAKLGGDKNPELRRAQVAWLKFRELERLWIAKRAQQQFKAAGGGTMYGLQAHAEQFEITRSRGLTLYYAAKPD